MTTHVATVLIVDDEASIRLSVEITLRALPVRCVLAENGQRALDLIRTDPPDLIILDVMMPVMNGYEFLRAYRKQSESHCPVIILTAKYDDMDRYWSQKLDVCAYIQKPFEARELRKAVESALAAQPAPGIAPP